MDGRYRATMWRKKLERGRTGWRRFTSASLPCCVIEFHIIHNGYLYSIAVGTARVLILRTAVHLALLLI